MFVLDPRSGGAQLVGLAVLGSLAPVGTMEAEAPLAEGDDA
jgi:hypothetical protein